MNKDLTSLDDKFLPSPTLLTDLREIINQGKSQAVAAVNSTLHTALIEIKTRLAERKLLEEP